MDISITLVIVIITVLISYRGFNNYEAVNMLKHSPFMEVEKNQWYRLLTGGFVHADWLHLIFNMYVLWVFGEYVETIFVYWFGLGGKLVYLLVYLLAIAVSSIPSLIREKENIGYAAIGASGAVSAIVFIFILLDPWAMLGIMFIIPMPAIVAGVLYLIYSYWAANRGGRGLTGRPVGHDAHFTGSLFGILAVAVLQPPAMAEFVRQLLNPSFF